MSSQQDLEPDIDGNVLDAYHFHFKMGIFLDGFQIKLDMFRFYLLIYATKSALEHQRTLRTVDTSNSKITETRKKLYKTEEHRCSSQRDVPFEFETIP